MPGGIRVRRARQVVERAGHLPIRGGKRAISGKIPPTRTPAVKNMKRPIMAVESSCGRALIHAQAVLTQALAATNSIPVSIVMSHDLLYPSALLVEQPAFPYQFLP